MTGVDLTQIDGVDGFTALKVVSVIGTDMTKWPTAKHFASWLGLSPDNKVTGGKIISSRTKASANRAAAALRMATYPLHRSDSALGAFLRRKKAQLGAPKAITATAHKLARIIYSMLRYGQQYVDAGAEYYEAQYRHRALHAAKRRAAQLGYQLIPMPSGQGEAKEVSPAAAAGTPRGTELLGRQKLMEGKIQETAAAKAGMSVRSARRWQCGPLPSETKQERWWRTRQDPFDGVWEEEIEPLLQGEAAGKLRATTIIEWLEEQHPGRFSASQLRTLQRRLQDWRARNGPEQEVYFPQEHPPGREAQIDFTHCNSLGVSIGGRPYRHLLFQLVLSHSGWRYAEVVAGETFLALKQGLQNALWHLGAAPQVIRSDNTSALTHKIKSGRALNDSYAELPQHCGMESTRTNSGEAHENGVAEQAHNRLKDALYQALMPRGSRDFDFFDDYTRFVRKVVERRIRLVLGKLEQERRHLRPLPSAPMPEYANYEARVRKWSTVQVAGRTYSVPSRLIGKEVRIRLYADWVEVYYKGILVERMERVHGEGEANVNYRHVIGSLVRKPGAFARYRFREQLFPTRHFRLAYDGLRQWRGERADVEYVRVLHLAATTMEATVDSALSLLLETGESFDYGVVRELAEPKVPEAPALTLSGLPDLKVYDRLLTGSLATAAVCG